MRLPRLLIALCLALPFAATAGTPKPKVKFTTSLGAFTVELEPEAAPKTVANFLTYVRSGHFKGTTFHRVIPGFMIQGGGHAADLKEKPAPRRVENEADLSLAKGLRNRKGTIAMARTQDPHSASAQFFVNTVDNAMLDFRSKDLRGWGYCAFGQVVEGMETVEKISAAKTHTQYGPQGPMQDVPMKAVVITDVQEVKEAPAKTAAKPATKPAPKKKAAKTPPAPAAK